MFRLMRIDYAVIAMVVADMALKPTGDDVFTLVAMTAVLVAVAAPTILGGRAKAFAAGQAG